MRAFVFTILAAVAYAQNDAVSDYVPYKENGTAYRVMYQSQTWNRAKMECERLGASLAVPKSQDEFLFIQRLVRGMQYPLITGTDYKLLVWLGINNLENFRVWRNLDGDDINDTGFHTWASDSIGFSNDPKEPHCAGMDARNPGLRTYWCHLRQPYICQKQAVRVIPLTLTVNNHLELA